MQAIAEAGRARVRDALSMRAVYAYMSRALRAAGTLLAYHAAEGARWSNASLMASDPGAFAAQLRNDTSYPETSRVAAEDWAAVVQRLDYSSSDCPPFELRTHRSAAQLIPCLPLTLSVGADFHRSGVALRTLVEEIHAKQRAEQKAKEAQRQRDKEATRLTARAGKRGELGGAGAKVYARRGRARGGRGRRRQVD